MKYKGYKIFKEKDTEGRKVYYVGVEGYEPSRICPIYSRKEARKSIKERIKEERR